MHSLDPLDFYDVAALLGDDERLIRNTVARFVDREVTPIIAECFAAERFPAELVPRLAELGLIRIQSLKSDAPVEPPPARVAPSAAAKIRPKPATRSAKPAAPPADPQLRPVVIGAAPSRSRSLQLALIGVAIIGIFVLSWIISTAVYRLRRYDELEPAPSITG